MPDLAKVVAVTPVSQGAVTARWATASVEAMRALWLDAEASLRDQGHADKCPAEVAYVLDKRGCSRLVLSYLDNIPQTEQRAYAQVVVFALEMHAAAHLGEATLLWNFC